LGEGRRAGPVGLSGIPVSGKEIPALSAKRPHSYVGDVGISVADSGTAPLPEIRHHLAWNESFVGPSPAALAAAATCLDGMQRYPDPACTELRAASGQAEDLDPAGIVCGNGSEELLDVIARCFARPGDEILFPAQGFILFSVVSHRVGATQVRAPEPAHATDVDHLLGLVTDRTRIVFVANPNNPTGTWLDATELRRLHAGLPGDVVLVVDGAYAEYGPEAGYGTGMELAKAHPNVIVTRTFSKAHGLAALRIGWAFGAPALMQSLNQVRGVGNVNAVAQAAALAALGDAEFLARAVAETARERARLAAALHDLGLAVLPGFANFVTAEFAHAPGRTAEEAVRHLVADGILIRGLAEYGLADFIRVSVGGPDATAAVAASLGRFLAGHNRAATGDD